LKRISVERKAHFGWQAFPETKLPALLQAGGTDFHAQTLLACTAASTSCDLQWSACAIADASLETGLAGLAAVKKSQGRLWLGQDKCGGDQHKKNQHPKRRLNVLTHVLFLPRSLLRWIEKSNDEIGPARIPASRKKPPIPQGRRDKPLCKIVPGVHRSFCRLRSAEECPCNCLRMPGTGLGTFGSSRQKPKRILALPQ